ncbi:hypothetical protein ACFV84_36140 [Kitasatospora sp. NPDC059811]|uniref:hypothetical protein n=1 Tax=Streptomycetaceae TaxID=2062 RepID=UPI0007AEE9D8|nr:hypothetical protein [Streptomyces sp. MJM8645]
MSWRILASRITHDGAGHLSVTICHHRPRGRGVFYLTGLALPGTSTEHAVYCPVCAADRGLTVAGTWGDPARASCPDGHTWTPYLPDLPPQRLLREVVRQALGGGGLHYREARTDPETTPPTPLRDAVRTVLTEAARALNQGEWTFDDYETRVALDLVRRSRWPDTLTGQDEATDAARLGWLDDGLVALHEYSRLTTGRLGELLVACDTALTPAARLSPDNLEPGSDPYNPPALHDAELALGGLRQVLVAGGTGDVAW